MVAEHTPGGDSNVVPLRATDAGTPAGLAEADPPAYADTSPAGARRPIIPAGLRRENIGGTVSQAAGLHWHRARYHGIRSPWYLTKTLGFAVVGAHRLLGRLVNWWSWKNGWRMESEAVAAGRAGLQDALRTHTEGKKTRSVRGRILAVAAVLLAVFLLVMAVLLPWWVWPAAGVAAVFLLARHGKPAGTPMVRRAVVPATYERPTPEIITRALGSLNISAISKAIESGRGLNFVSDVARDGDGWGCDLDLPHGVTPRMILQRREQFASGLRRPLSATWPEGVPGEHEGRLRVWVGFHDISKARPRPSPLLRAPATDVFMPVPFGTDPRGRPVTVPLFEVNWLIGAAPGQGKTAAVRDLACAAALDTVCDLWVHELAGKGDLEPLAKVCHRYTSGLDDEAVTYTAASARMLRTELERRSAILKKVPRERRPDGKLTRDLAADPRLRPLVCVIDECQVLFMADDIGKKAAEDIAHVMRLGRAYGIILVLATQRPTAETIPTAISGNVTGRFCLKVTGQPENDTILGTGAYKAGYNAVAFRLATDAGLGWLRGDGDPQVVRTYYLDLPATEKIATRARALRDRAGVLSGYALGEVDTGETRSFAADVLSVFGSDRNLWCDTIATRLRERIPGAYADITQEAVGSQLRALDVEVKQVREPGRGVRAGCQRDAIEAVTSHG